MTFGTRRGKVILSVRTNREELHVGRILSNNFPEGLAGGHKTLGGGQIPFDFITGNSEITNEDEVTLVLERATELLKKIFV